jgi:hypothetical protein
MNARMLAVAFGFAIAFVLYIGFMFKADHRTDRNIPGATTAVGKSSIAD